MARTETTPAQRKKLATEVGKAAQALSSAVLAANNAGLAVTLENIYQGETTSCRGGIVSAKVLDTLWPEDPS